MKENKGITLIALIITIIIMLILVGVTITMLTGENGILNQGKKSIKETYHGTVKDQIILCSNQYQIDKRTNQFEGDIIEYLSTNKYISKVDGSDYYRVDVEKVAKNVKTGKGATKTKGDIYVIEEYNDTTTAKTTKLGSLSITDVKRIADDTAESKQYVLRYYEKEDSSKILLYLSGNGRTVEPEPTPDPDEENYDKIVSVKKIEDLLDVAMYVENGQKNMLVKLENDLDFANKDDYREPDKYYKNPITGNRMSLDSLKEVTVDGGSNGASDADATNDSNKATSSVYMELNKDTNNSNTPGFIQIGNSSDKPFDGVFNGKGHTIKNVDMSSYSVYSSTEDKCVARSTMGFIGYNDGIIKNLNISKTEGTSNSILKICSNIDTAILVGTNNGTIENCNVDIKNETYNYDKITKFGTIACNNAGLIQQCTNNAVLNITTKSEYIAGIVGYNTGEVNNCTNNGNISIINTYYLGGIVGLNEGKVTNCVNTGILSAGNVGGIICINNSAEEISDCVNGIKGTDVCFLLSNGGNAVAGIVAVTEGGSLNVTNCTNYISITNSYYASGIAVNVNRSSIPSSGSNMKIKNCKNYADVEGTTYAGGIYSASYSDGGWAKIEITECENTGTIKVNGSGYVGGMVSSWYGGELVLNSCINRGSINAYDNAGGLIGYNSSKNGKTTIDYCYNYGSIGRDKGEKTERAGGIIGRNSSYTEIKNSTNYGNIVLSYHAGGFVGYTDKNVLLTNCINKGNVQGSQYSGGFIGMVSMRNTITEINDCINEGIVTVENVYAGGIIGYAGNNIYLTNCQNKIKITGIGYAGGLIGYADSAHLDSCKNSGEVNGSDCAGGMIGEVRNSSEIKKCINSGKIEASRHAAGIVGTASSNVGIISCGNSGEIKGGTLFTSGLVDQANVVINSYNTGTITGTTDIGSSAGGICSNISSTPIINCYNAGTVINGSSIGNSYKKSSSTLINVYSLSGVASQYIKAAEGETYDNDKVTIYDGAEKMKAQSFVDLLNKNSDSYGKWVIGTSTVNNGYPVLEE